MALNLRQCLLGVQKEIDPKLLKLEIVDSKSKF